MRRWLTVLGPVATRVGVLAIVAPALAVAVVLGLSARAEGADHPVNSESDLRTAITSAVDGDTITFNVDVTLTEDLPAIKANITIVGNNKVLDGNSTYRGLFVAKFTGILGTPAAVTVTIQDLTIRHARARGGAGKDNAGGGAGLGGALFVANLATVTVSNVHLDTNDAIGGLGGVDGIFGGGGGGGLGGFGGAGTGGGGGGVGRDASGGNGGVGEDGTGGIILGPASGGNGAGSGFGGGGSNGGGGGGSGGTSAGAGGGGVAGGPGLNTGPGGNGGFGGGGGGAGDTSRLGGTGGFGGGGGASGVAGGSATSVGGFGGGGAGGSSGGFGGGAGAISLLGYPGGGGGAGLGGALFVQAGGSLTLAGPLTITGSTVTGGAVLDAGATGGSAFGSGVFLQGNGGPLTFTPGAGQTQTVANDIADQTGSGGTGGNAGSWGLTKSGAGTLTLSGANTYSGATTVSAGTLIVDGSINSPVTVQGGGTLGGAGTISNTVTVQSGGTLSPGSSTEILSTGTLTLTAGSTLAVEINGTTVGIEYDQVNVTGGVTLGNATLNVVPGFTPSAGQTFTIIANDLSDAVGGIFLGRPEASIFTAGAGRFRISYVGGSGNDVTLTALNVPPTIAKSFGVANLTQNGTTSLTFTLTNPDPGAALTGVGFSDTLPVGLTVANGTTGMCGGTLTTSLGNTIALSGATIAPGGACTFPVTVTGTTLGVKVNTTGPVSSTEGGPGGTATANLTVVAPVPPTIAKAFGALIIGLNGTTTLTFTLTNPNTAALTGVAFSDTLPAGLTVANGATPTCGGTLTTSGGNTIALVGATIASGGTCMFSVTVTGTVSGPQNNTTGAVSSTEGGAGGTATASLSVLNVGFFAPPTLGAAFGAASIVVNGTTTLTFPLTNPNAAALTGVGFTAALLPSGLVVATLNGLTSTCVGTVTAVAGTSSVGLVNGAMPGGGACTITVNVTGTTAGAKNTTTSAVTSNESAAGGTASASLAVVAPPTIAKAFGAASLGLIQKTTLTFTVTNPVGNGATLTAIAFTDALPAGLKVAAPNGLTGSCGGGTITAAAGGTSLSLAGATLAAGTSCVFAIDVRAVAAGPQTNTTSAVTSANGGAGTAATAAITVTAPNLTIAKHHGAGFAKGQTGQYTITVSNTGPGPTAGVVTVTDTLPAGLTATSLSGAGWACTLASLSCARFNALGAGASYPPITLTVSIAATAPDSLTNTATVSGGGDTSAGDNTASDTINLAAAPTLSTLAQVVFVLLVLLSGLRLLRRRPTTGR